MHALRIVAVALFAVVCLTACTEAEVVLLVDIVLAVFAALAVFS